MSTASTDLIIKLPAVISQVKEAVDRHAPDTSTRTGREAIASLAHKVARTKTALVKEGKKLTEDWREKTNKVNAACNTIEERMSALKADVRRPLTEWEKAEEDRTDGHQKRLQSLIAFAKVGFGHTSEDLKGMLAEVEAFRRNGTGRRPNVSPPSRRSGMRKNASSASAAPRKPGRPKRSGWRRKPANGRSRRVVHIVSGLVPNVTLKY